MRKNIKGREYLYLYKSVWRDGRSRNVFIRYLGPAERLTEPEIRRVIKDEEGLGSTEVVPGGRGGA